MMVIGGELRRLGYEGRRLGYDVDGYGHVFGYGGLSLVMSLKRVIVMRGMWLKVLE